MTIQDEIQEASDIKVNKQVIKKEKAPFDIRDFFGKPWVLLILFILIIIPIVLFLNWLINLLNGTFQAIMNHFSNTTTDIFDTTILYDELKSVVFSIGTVFKINDYLLIFFVLCAIASFLVLSKLYSVYVRYRKVDYGQHGDARWTTKKELQEQYKAVPQVLNKYNGQSGFPIAHFGNEYFIETETFNTLIIGTSRSGKGVTSVVPSIDIDSRAEKQPSLIVADPKGELAGASYETLRKRGYDVEILNISNPEDGMSYNPLALITQYYKRGDLDNAQKYTKSLTHTLFHDPNTKDQTWNNFASSTTQALILAIVDYCIKSDQEEKITMRNVYNMLLTYAGNTYMSEETGEERSKLDDYMEQLKKQNPQHPAVIAYGTVEFSKGKTRSSIFTTVSGKLDDINKDAMAKMMSRHSIDFKRPGFNKYLEMKFNSTYKYRKGQLIINHDSYSFKIDRKGYADLNFKTKLNTSDEIKLVILDKEYLIKTKRKPIQTPFGVEKRDPYTQEIVYKDELELEIPEDSPLKYMNVIYREKPVAIFMVVPDYDTSEHFIASIFISQLYTELAREASKSGGKCYTRVKFRLDEFGNFPTISDMSNIMTVCLGRNILFELYIQELEQVNSKYSKEEAETIIANCQNKIYIKSTSDNTTETISKLAGERTVKSVSQSAGRFDTDLNENISVEKKRLITADELRNFTMGETMVLRPLKTRDLNNNDVRPYPILNSGKNQMPRSFETLSQWFDTSTALSEFQIPSKHRNVDLISNNIDFNDMMTTQGGFTLTAYVDVSRHGNQLYSELRQYIINTFNLVDDTEFRQLVNQDSQTAFYNVLKSQCERFKQNYNDVKLKVNKIISSGDNPVEAPLEIMHDTDTEQYMSYAFFDAKNYEPVMFEEIKRSIDTSDLRQADKEFLKTNATFETGKELLLANDLEKLYNTAFNNMIQRQKELKKRGDNHL